MSLNPEEVVNKRFSPTKFRQGYDEEEVDEFLDEVVGELRRLNAENDELRSKLSACEGRVSELSRGGASDVAAKTPEAESGHAPVTPPVLTPAPTPTPAPAPMAAVSGVEGATGMLALAQKLHDEHVEAGKTERTKIVGEAQEHATRLVREAEDKQRKTLGDLEQQRSVLERKVEELRSFEREYRSRLKAYLEGQLRDLESKAPVAGGRGETSSTTEAGSAGGQGSSSDGVNQLANRGADGSDEDAGDGERQGQQDAPRSAFGS